MEPQATGQPRASPAGSAISPSVSCLRSNKNGPGHCACSERPLPPAASPPRLLCGRRGSRVWRRTVPSFPEPLGGSGLTEDLAAGRKPPEARFSVFAGSNSHFPRDTPPPGTNPIPVSICLPRHRYGTFFLEPEVT